MLKMQRLRLSINYEDARQFLQDYAAVPLMFIAIYVVAIAYGPTAMRHRKPFKLTKCLFLWNSFLAIFSLCGFIVAFEEFYHVMATYGFHHSVCKQSKNDDYYTAWSLLFVFSKIFELVDTSFIILRRKPLQFLHYYHHITVIIFGWFSSTGPLGYARYIMTLNFFVHSIMYTYYALKTVHLVRIPRWVSMVVTTLQTTQMVVGCVVSIYAWLVLKAGKECEITYFNIKLSLICYGTYFILFVKLFVNAYLRQTHVNVSKST